MSGEVCRVLHGNCFELVGDIEDGSIDFILTDIPYVISRENNFKTMRDRKGRTGIDFGEWDKSFEIERMEKLQRLLKNGGSLLTFHSFEQFSELKDVLNELEFKDKIIWQKTNPMPRNRDRRWISDIEIASWYVKKGAKWTFNRQHEKYEGSVLRYPSESGGGYTRYHPNQKNLKMVEYLLKIHSNEGDTVLDCFMGGGTTGVACVNTNRKFVGIESDDRYYKVARERINIALKQGR